MLACCCFVMEGLLILRVLNQRIGPNQVLKCLFFLLLMTDVVSMRMLMTKDGVDDDDDDSNVNSNYDDNVIADNVEFNRAYN